jgi:hypothetical protein
LETEVVFGKYSRHECVLLWNIVVLYYGKSLETGVVFGKYSRHEFVFYGT